MTILQEVEDELVAASGRPPLTTRISIRVVAVVIAAVLALLIAAPPSLASRSVSARMVTTQMLGEVQSVGGS
jgi:hypothetical protein